MLNNSLAASNPKDCDFYNCLAASNTKDCVFYSILLRKIWVSPPKDLGSIIRHRREHTSWMRKAIRIELSYLMARPETLAGEPEVVSEPGYRLLDLPLRVDHPFDVGHQQPVLAHENVIDVHLNVPEKKNGIEISFIHTHLLNG